MKQWLLNKSILMCLRAALMFQIRHSSLIDSGSNANCNIIVHTVDGILRQLEIKRENFSLFLVHVFGWKDIKGITLFFNASQLRCAFTT